jgi:hypothetical protein
MSTGESDREETAGNRLKTILRRIFIASLPSLAI